MPANWPAPLKRVKRWIGRHIPPSMRRFPRPRWGQFWSQDPLSTSYGYDRGLPIDRFYIENFLELHKQSIHGDVLEVKDDEYARRFGGDRVDSVTVIDIDKGNAKASHICDLNRPQSLPVGAFDCIILTQTLQLVFELRIALRSLSDSLKPGGVLLATFPGITRIAYQEMGDSWMWSFTEPVAQRLFEEVLPGRELEVTVHGNLMAATAFLHGLAVEDVDPSGLRRVDPDYPVVITVRAQKGT